MLLHAGMDGQEDEEEGYVVDHNNIGNQSGRDGAI